MTHLPGNLNRVIRKHWVALAKELQTDEEALKNTTPPHVRKILSGKRLLLFKNLLEETD